MICQICYQQKRELNGHLRTHNISSQDYQNKFPGAQIMCQESKELKSVGILKSIPNKPPISDATRKKMSKSRSKR